MSSETKIGFLGLGTMGQRIAANLRRAGYELAVYDIDEARTRPLVELGATAPGSLEAVVRDAGVVCTSLPHPAVFVRVAEEELLPRVAKGTVVVDFGTTLPSETRRLAGEFSARVKSVQLAEYASEAEPTGWRVPSPTPSPSSSRTRR